MLRLGLLCRLGGLASRRFASIAAQPLRAAPVPVLSQPRPALLAKLPCQPSVLEQIPLGVFEAEAEADNTIYMDSVLRKRRLKMKKHKLRKRRRLQRSLKKRLGKI